jgi:hypothetical protein
MTAHPKCGDGHVCQEPSGQVCIERGCNEAAGTHWSPLLLAGHDRDPLLCPGHDREWQNRVSASCVLSSLSWELL